MGVCEDIVHLLAGKKGLEDKNNDPDVLSKVNKADVAMMMETIKKYLRSCYGVVRVLLARIIMKMMIFPDL